jgi:hypothetical protein
MSLTREKGLSRSVAELPKATVPFLPGHGSTTNLSLTRANHRRPQTLIYKLDTAVEKVAQKPVPLDAETLKALSVAAPRAAAPGMGRSQSAAELRMSKKPSLPANQPAWLKHDRQCLRYYSYFQEHVVENPTENFRIRNVVMTYFLEDGTMQITEPKVENSGIWPQGPFVKRHRIPRKQGGFWGPEHFRMGAEVEIYGRVFRVVNGDEFTKWWYNEGGVDFGIEEEAPLDNFLETQVWKKQSLTKVQGYPADVMEGKEFNELNMGAGRKNKGMKQFLENDRKVLRFYAYWDDLTRYGARMYFTIHYFLADNTVEINNNYMRNVGRWLCPVFMTRAPLELNPTFVPFPGMIKAPSPVLTPADIEVGKSIPVYGREFFVYDCDDATKAFYEQYTGKRPEPIVIPEPQYYHKQLLPPPYTGALPSLGADEDSLGSCLKVTERNPPHRDIVRLMMFGNKALRYEAVPENNVPEDAHRKFTIEVFLADKTILVGEQHVRNSGCWDGGKFKERDMPGGERRTINPDTGKPFEPDEFYVGALVKISHMPMRITRADEFSLKYMETDPVNYPQSSFAFVAEKIAGLIKFESELPPTISPEDFRDLVAQALGYPMTDQELITVLRNCNEPDTADIRSDKLFELIRCPPPVPPPALKPGDPVPE